MAKHKKVKSYKFNLTGPNPEHLEKLFEGVDAWNNWRRKNLNVMPNLAYANLGGLDLTDVNLSNAEMSRSILSGSDMRNANFYQAELYKADLRECDFSGADIRGAKLHQSDMRGANLQGSHLYRADFISTRLKKAIFKHAYCSTTAFSGVDLSDVIGLDKVNHLGPSNIDISTLFISGQSIPKAFLRGAGLPDVFIEHLPSFITSQQSIQFYSCFISYSHRDEEFAKRLYSRMRESHFRVWFAPEDIKGGQKIHEQIDKAIHAFDKLLIVLSNNSMESEWVNTELRCARKRETSERRRVLFPMRLIDFDTIREWKCFDADSGNDLAMEIREYFMPDFSNWKAPDAFEASFARLVNDLRAYE